MSNRVVGGRYRVDKSSGQIQRDLLDPHKIPRFQEQKSSERLAKFHQTEMARSKRAPHNVPPLKIPPSKGVVIDENEKQRRRLENKQLSSAIKEAVTKKQLGQIEIPETMIRKQQQLQHLQKNRRCKTPLPAVYNTIKKQPRPVLLAGEKCNAAQARLAETDAFIGVQKYGKTQTKLFNGQGDMSKYPNGQIKSMLAETNGCDLNIPSRSADFRYEVDWRMGLRDADRLRPK